jgi:two-component SAPR family response regulator
MKFLDIIIGEYDPKTVLELERAILNLGHQVVHTVSTGEAAFNITQKLKPDLVLVDLDLKGEMKGVDVGKKISDDLNIPVIFITVFTKNCLTMSLQLPEDAVTLSKPIKQDHLKYAISNILRTK